MTINAGPQAVSSWHRDCANLAWGVCAIFVTGRFDHTSGGHLLLREAKVFLELQRGDIALIPSAVITHRNLPISEQETRRSLVFYSGGGMFRWLAQGSKPAKDMSAEDKQWMEAGNADRWERGLLFFPTVEELKQHWQVD